MFAFGSGVMTVTPSGAIPTPINIGLLQEGTIEMSQTVKELFAQNQDSVAIGAGTRKWTGKAKIGRFSLQVVNALFFGGSITTGQIAPAFEAQTVPAPSGPYTVTVTNAANFATDQGVIYAATGLPLKRVASVSATGQYSVNTSTGVYTFNSTDASAKLVISYNYNVSATGQTLVMPSRLLGQTLTFGLNFTAIDPTTNGTILGNFPNCVAEKLAFGTKLEDFTMPEIDFRLFASTGTGVGTWSTADSM